MESALLFHGISIFFLLISSIHADDSPALQTPDGCFQYQDSDFMDCSSYYNYPVVDTSYAGGSCGYPGLEGSCSPRKGMHLNISNNIYYVQGFGSYPDRDMVRLVDKEVYGRECPQPKRNFSLPSSPSWVNYHLSDYYNLTVFYNCSSVPANVERHLVCSDDHYRTTKTPPSYAFYQNEIPNWSKNCTETVVVPVSISKGELHEIYTYAYAMKSGFYMGWSATGWCKDCENSYGFCWSNSTATGCACSNGKSYNKSCPEYASTYLSESAAHKRLKIIIGVFAGIGLLLLAVLYYRGNKIRAVLYYGKAVAPKRFGRSRFLLDACPFGNGNF